jgi:hypothetical protein
VKLEPAPVLLGIGIAMIIVGAVFQTPFPVQLTEAIDAGGAWTGGACCCFSVDSCWRGLVTGVIWLLLGITGLSPFGGVNATPALLSVVLGLSFGFMLEGIRYRVGALPTCHSPQRCPERRSAVFRSSARGLFPFRGCSFIEL